MRSTIVSPAAVTAVAIGLATLGLAGGAGASTSAPDVVHVVAAENFWGNITSQLGGRDVDGDLAHHEPQRRPPPLRDRRGRRRHAGPGPGRDRERRRLRHLDELAPRRGRREPAARQRGDRAPRHRERSQPPSLVRHPPRAHRGRRHRRRAREGGAAGRPDLQGRTWPAFDASLAPLDATLATIKAHFHNVPVAYTERVPGYALAVADLDVKTPPGFARAIEDGVDPGPADTLAMQQLLDRPRHQRAALQRADGHAGHDPDPRPGPPATASPSSASPRPCPPAPPPTSSGSSPS